MSNPILLPILPWLARSPSPPERTDEEVRAQNARLYRQSTDKLRKKTDEHLMKLIAGRDLIQMSLTQPDTIKENMMLRAAVLGRAPRASDQNRLVKCVTNSVFKSPENLFKHAADPETGEFPPILDAWKLVLCDVCWVPCDDQVPDIDAALKARQAEEDQQTNRARAWAAVHTEEEQQARRNAVWFIDAMKGMTPDELAAPGLTKSLWAKLSPPPPGWVQHIVDEGVAWGFTWYASPSMHEKAGTAWPEMWDMMRQHELRPGRVPGRDLKYASIGGVHCRGHLDTVKALWKEHWPEVPSECDLRQHFAKVRHALPSTGILENTFLVVDEACSNETSASTDDEGLDFSIWAYDANWTASSQEGQGVDEGLDDDTYHGRVKVDLRSVGAWFYAACKENTPMQDLWRKAQTMPGKTWMCRSKALEEWENEPFTF